MLFFFRFKERQAVRGFTRRLELITEVDLAAVPQRLLTNQWMVLKAAILAPEDQLTKVGSCFSDYVT
jgi:hypothetical protein